MIRFVDTLKQLTFSLSFVLINLLTDPSQFFKKACAKLGISEPSIFQTSPLAFEKAESLGDMTEALLKARHHLGRHPLRALATIRRINAQKQTFDASIEQSLPLSTVREHSPKLLYFVGNSYPHTNSGYSKRTHQVSSAFSNAGIPTVVVTRFGYPTSIGVPFYPVELRLDSIRYLRLTAFRFPTTHQSFIDESTNALVRTCLREKPDILQTTTGFINAIIVSRAARILGIPWTYEVRGHLEDTWLSRPGVDGIKRSLDSEFYRQWQAKETAAATKSALVIVLSEISKQILVERGVPSEKIAVARNSSNVVSPKSHRPSRFRTRLGLPADGIWVGCITSLVAYEGIDTLLHALKYLPSDVRCLIVGDGVEKTHLEKLASDLEIQDRVIFSGKVPQDEILDWYCALDVFVTPRHDERVTQIVTPIKMTDAMALGIPIVASDLPALKEITYNQSNYFSAESPEDLAATLTRVIKTLPNPNIITAAQVKTWEENLMDVCRLYRQGGPNR